jgi:cell division protein FtsI (penicillin-binding protein 3)
VSGLSRAVARARGGRRLGVFLVGYLLLTLLMAGRLVSVQVVSAAEYRGLADRQSQRDLELAATRGRIYDRSGEALAMSLAAATVYANPRALAAGGIDPTFVAADLAPLLGRSMDELMVALTRDAAFVYLGRQLPRQVGEQVAALRLPGIGVLEEPRRVYPNGGLASQIVGFAGIDNTGLDGLELQYDDVLAGQPGRLRLERAPGGVTIPVTPREVEPPLAGTDIVLTIDRQIQWVTEQALIDAVARYNAAGASAIVQDVATGEILAMASVPSFDPADPAATDPYERRNRAVTDIFEPGSVNKVITAAAALEEGLVRPDEIFTVPDHLVIGPKRFRDSSPHATWEITFAEVLARSSNVGTIQVAQRLGDERMHTYLQRFGYGQATGLGFPGESRGLLPPHENWWITSLPTIAIGQGVSATLLQVANVFRTVASDGWWTEPTLVRGTVAGDGRLEPASVPRRREAVSPETAATIREMLVGTIEAGTGSLAAVPGYTVGGKTGTAQKPSRTSRGYEEGAYIASFAGFAPAEHPALVIAVMIDEPRPVFYGGLTAAPVFAEIMEFSLAHRRVPPSDPFARATAEPAPAPPPPPAATDTPAPVPATEPDRG